MTFLKFTDIYIFLIGCSMIVFTSCTETKARKDERESLIDKYSAREGLNKMILREIY